MQFVIIAEHSPELCPMSNAKIRDLMKESATEIPSLAEKLGVNIITTNVFGPDHVIHTVGAEHVRRDDVDSQFLGQTRDLRGRFLHQVANLGVGHWAQLGRMLSDNHELHLCLPFSWSSSRERRPEHTTARARSRDLSG